MGVTLAVQAIAIATALTRCCAISEQCLLHCQLMIVATIFGGWGAEWLQLRGYLDAPESLVALFLSEGLSVHGVFVLMLFKDGLICEGFHVDWKTVFVVICSGLCAWAFNSRTVG